MMTWNDIKWCQWCWILGFFRDFRGIFRAPKRLKLQWVVKLIGSFLLAFDRKYRSFGVTFFFKEIYATNQKYNQNQSWLACTCIPSCFDLQRSLLSLHVTSAVETLIWFFDAWIHINVILFYTCMQLFSAWLIQQAIDSPFIAESFITPYSYLIFASSKAVTFHSTHIAIARMMKLSYCRCAPDMIKNWRHSTTKGCYHITCHVPLEPHGTHLSHSRTKLP